MGGISVFIQQNSWIEWKGLSSLPDRQLRNGNAVPLSRESLFTAGQAA